MQTLRVLLANEPRTYREFLAAALETLNPHIQVLVVEPDELDSSVAHLRPHLVVCSQLTDAVQFHPLSWVLLYPGGESSVTISVAGERETSGHVGLADLLSVIDRTQRLVQPC